MTCRPCAVYKKSDDSNNDIAEVIIAKQRNAPIDTIKLTFLSEFTRFENYIEREDYAMGYDEAEDASALEHLTNRRLETKEGNCPSSKGGLEQGVTRSFSRRC